MTELEIRQGMFRLANRTQRCLFYERNIVNLNDNLNVAASHKYIDIDPVKTEVDEEAQNLLKALRYMYTCACMVICCFCGFY